MKRYFFVISILAVMISGCIDFTNETKIVHSGWFEDIGNNYVLIPTLLFRNTTFNDAKDYNLEKGEGTITQEFVNGTLMLNISSSSNNVEFKYEKKDNSSNINDYSFSNEYFNPSYNSTIISIFYSGNNECYSFFNFEIHDDFEGFSWDVGPMGLIHGWNEVGVYRDGWIV
jgi:hypothetical protein